MEAPEEHHHKVNFSNSISFAASFKSDLKETFFPDDPFRQFKNQSASNKTLKAIKYFIPIAEWAPKYSFAKFGYDVLSGITIASIAIPQGISYARLANLPPIIGLYSSFVPPLVYAIFGSSKDLAVGPVAAASLLLASIIGEEVSASEDPSLYLYLFFTSAFFTGVLEVALGLFRLGILIDFLSGSTITGFMGGTAIITILQQLKGMLGLEHFTAKTDLISVIRSVLANRHEWKWQSAVLGMCFLCFLLLTRLLKTKVPKLFWVSAISPLLVVILGGTFAYIIHGENHGIPTVGPLKRGLNPLSITQINFQSQYLSTTMKAGLISGFLALAEGIAVGRSFAMMKNDQIDGNKEMIAFGLMNIVGSFTSCYLTTGPFSKSAVNFHAGCKTAMSNVVMSICMMLVLLFLAPLFQYTPLVALSAIITVAMIGIIDYGKVRHLFKVDKFDFCICIAAFLGVVFISMDVGLMLSVGMSILRTLLYVARPITCKLGDVEGTEIYRDTKQYPNSSSLPGILILQLGSPIYFANSNYLRERILRWVENEQIISEDGGDVQYVILDMGGVTSIDNMGIEMLQQVQKSLERRGVKIALSNPRVEVVEKLVVSNYMNLIGMEWVFLSIKDAVAACHFGLHEESRNKGLQV